MAPDPELGVMRRNLSVEFPRRRWLVGVSARALLCTPMAAAIGVALGGSVQAGTVNPVQTTTYTLTPSNNPITFGSGTNINTTATPGANAVTGGTSAQYSITNQGNLTASSYGVQLTAAGSITNQVGGNISGWLNRRLRSAALARATVANSGLITGTNACGVTLTAGGAVTNNAGGTIQGAAAGEYQTGVYISGGTGDVSNAGYITGGSGVALRAGGVVTNSANIASTGLNGFGVVITGSGGNVCNRRPPVATSRPRASAASGVVLTAGGSVANDATARRSPPTATAW